MCQISKVLLKFSKEFEDVFTNPKKYFGPNTDQLLQFWSSLDTLNEGQLKTVEVCYVNFYDNHESEWDKTTNEAIEASEKTVGKKFANAAAYFAAHYGNVAFYATKEIIGGVKKPVFLPMFEQTTLLDYPKIGEIVKDCNRLHEKCNKVWPQIYEILSRNKDNPFTPSLIVDINGIIESYKTEDDKIFIYFSHIQERIYVHIMFRNKNSNFKRDLCVLEENRIDQVLSPIALKPYVVNEVVKKLREFRRMEIAKECLIYSGLSECLNENIIS